MRLITSAHGLAAARRLGRTLAAAPRAARAFSTHTVPSDDGEPVMHPVTSLNEEEAMMRDAAERFAKEEVGPRVRAMDEAGVMDKEIVDGLFASGFFGVEIAERYGGVGSSFTSALLVVEELARVDPSVSVMIDIHNTIVNNCFTVWASDRLKDQWLPRLATDTVGAFALSEAASGSDAFALRCAARE